MEIRLRNARNCDIREFLGHFETESNNIIQDCGVASSNTIFIVNLQKPHSRLDLATFLLIRCAFSKFEEKKTKIIESGVSELFVFC